MIKEQKEKIIQLRCQGQSYADIANIIGVSKEAVRSVCRRNNCAEKLNFDKVDVCRECSKPIMQEPNRKKQIFCCKACREKWWKEHPEQVKQKAVYSFTCKCCGNNFTAYGNSKRRYCSHECYIKDRFGGGADE